MTWLAAHPWLALVVPGALAVVGVVLPSSAGRSYAWIAMLGPAMTAGVGIAVAATAPALQAEGGPYWGREPVMGAVTWLAHGDVQVELGYAVDGLSAVMLSVAGVVALMVMLFSVGYMHGEEGYKRYFATLSLFTASMAGLVMADGLLGLFIAWELVGLCSYLLIGFWYRKPSASAAALKAFMTTRVGDGFMLLALALVWSRTGSLSFEAMAAEGALGSLAGAAALLLFLGAAGKSAQFPLHIWLPDAMEGPTPVSALIHAATMVAAGVYLMARTGFLLDQSSSAATVVVATGTITALGAALVAVTQTDIKKVLAYSTISQLGFMFVAIGAFGAMAGIFHLVTHAAFKALLFLGSGSVIHGSGTQDLREMGGLAKRMPWTAAAWIAGSAALVGIPPMAGFFSKEEILVVAHHNAPVAWVVLVATAMLTAFYTARVTQLAFFGEERGSTHAHESGWTMLLPLGVLSAGAVSLGVLGPWVRNVLGGDPVAIGDLLREVVTLESAVVVTGAVAAAALGAALYRQGPSRDTDFERALRPAWVAMRTAYGFDAAVMRWVVGKTVLGAETLHEGVDRRVIDGAAEVSARLAGRAGRALAKIQTGDGQRYAALIAAGVIALIAISGWAGR